MYLSCLWMLSVYSTTVQMEPLSRQTNISSMLQRGMSLHQAEKSLALWAEKPLLTTRKRFSRAYISQRFPNRVVILECTPTALGDWSVIRWATRSKHRGEIFVPVTQRGTDISKLLSKNIPLSRAKSILGVWGHQFPIFSGFITMPFLTMRYPGKVVWLTSAIRGGDKSIVMDWKVLPFRNSDGPIMNSDGVPYLK